MFQGNSGVHKNNVLKQNHGDVCENVCEKLFDRSLIVNKFLDSQVREKILILCAEPRMGKTTLMHELRAFADYRGWKCYDFSLSGYSPKEATAYISRKSYDISRYKSSKKPRIAFFDDVPESDEAFVIKQARAFMRLRSAGCAVIISCLPEAAQIVEEIPNCLVFGAQELLLDESGSKVSSAKKIRAVKLTRRIPGLVGALQESMLDTPDSSLGVGFQEALVTLLLATVRESLCHEELIARVILLLLGRGSFQDIETVAGKKALEYTAFFEINVPFFGIDSARKHFNCLLNDRPDLLEACVPILRRYACFMEIELQKAALLLKMRRDFKRMSIVCRLLGENNAWSLVLPNAVELIDAGESKLVNNSFLMVRNRDALSSDNTHALEGVLSCMVQGASKHKELGSLISNKAIASSDAFISGSALIASARMLVAKPLPFVSESIDVNSETARCLLLHRKVFSLIRVGKLLDAHRLLSLNSCYGQKNMLSSALLTIDNEILRILLKLPETVSPSQVNEAVSFLEASGIVGIKSYVGIIRSLQFAEQQETDANTIYEIERYSAQSEERGDIVAQAVELLSASILDMRNKAYARAHIHAHNAALLAEKVHSDYLFEAGSILAVVASFMLGELPKEGRTRWIVNSSLYAVYQVILNAMDSFSGSRPSMETETLASSIPQDALWLLRALLQGIGHFSEELARFVPETWKHMVNVLPYNKQAQAVENESDEREKSSASETVEKRGIYLSILGGFSLSVNGVVVPENALGKRYAKLLLIYLALSRKHAARRYAIVDALWPNCPYESGMEKIYQATRVIRKVVASVDKTLDPIISIRGEKTISLNNDIFSVDVDRFEELARMVTSASHDDELVRLSQEVRMVYRGDLYVPSDDAFIYVESMRRNLSQKYVEIMTAGSEAALRAGYSRLAVLLAENAVLVDEDKEDSAIAFIKAMKACGRTSEAQQYYTVYIRRFLKQRDELPSKELRMMASEDFANQPEQQRKKMHIEDSTIEIP